MQSGIEKQESFCKKVEVVHIGKQFIVLKDISRAECARGESGEKKSKEGRQSE